MEVGKTDTEGGPVVGREHREEVVDRRTVSTTHKHATKSKEPYKHGYGHVQHTNTHGVKNTRRRGGTQEERKGESDMRNVVLLHPRCPSVNLMLGKCYFKT